MEAPDDGLTLSTIKFTGLAYFQTVFAEETIVDLDYGFRVRLSAERGGVGEAYWTCRWRWYWSCQ
jgi:hypothetical protein